MTCISPICLIRLVSRPSTSFERSIRILPSSIISSPEPLGLQGELLVYPSSRRPSVVRRSQCSKIFFAETAGQIKAKFYMEPPWVGGTIFCSRHLGHMTKMAATPIYGKNPSKNLLQNRRADFHETWYVASGTPAHHNLFK